MAIKGEKETEEEERLEDEVSVGERSTDRLHLGGCSDSDAEDGKSEDSDGGARSEASTPPRRSKGRQGSRTKVRARARSPSSEDEGPSKKSKPEMVSHNDVDAAEVTCAA